MLFQMISVCKHVLDNLEMLKERILQQFIIKYHIIAMFKNVHFLSLNIRQFTEEFCQILEIYIFISFFLRNNQYLGIRVATTDILIGEPFAQFY